MQILLYIIGFISGVIVFTLHYDWKVQKFRNKVIAAERKKREEDENNMPRM
jgi:hypothetical protein